METQVADELKKTHIYVYSTDSKLVPFPNLTYRTASEFLLNSTDEKMQSVGLWAIARFMNSTDEYSYTYQMRRQGSWSPPYDEPWLQKFTGSKKHLLKRSIQLDPENAYAYNTLASITYIYPPVILYNGQSFNKENLYVKAAELGCAEAYYHLAMTPYTIVMSDGSELSKYYLFEKAIMCCPDNYVFHLEYAIFKMSSDRRACIHLLLEALRFIPLCIIPDDTRNRDMYIMYSSLARCSQRLNESITMWDGRVLTANKLFIEALKCDEDDSLVCYCEITEDEPWCISSHVAFGGKTNRLFATLLLALQTLEEKQIIHLAHQAMFEDMLECYTHGNTK